MRRLLLLLLLLGVLAAWPVTGQEIVLELWDGITGPDRDGIDALVAQFNEEHAGEIRVNRLPALWDELYAKVYVAVAGGVAPDVWIMHRDRLPEQALVGTLRPIDAYYAELGLTDEDFLPGLGEGGIFADQRYGIPLDVHPLALYYNEEHFLQAGIPGPPTNSAEFRQYAKLLTRRQADDTVTQWGARIADQGTQMYTLLGQFGADLYGGENYEEPLPDAQVALAALEYIRDMFHMERVAHAHAWTLSQDSSMMVDGIWFLSEVQQLRSQTGLNIKVAPADRVFGDKRAAIWAGSHMFTFPKQSSDNPERMRAALRFVNWMSENSLEWSRWGQLPARTAVISHPDFRALGDHLVFAQQDFHFFGPTPWATGGPVMMDMAADIMFGNVSPGTVLEHAKQGLYNFLAERRMEDGQ